MRQISANYDAPNVERNVQKYWAEGDIYKKVKEELSTGESYYFLDGPPYTTGAIHLGTAMNKTLKDVKLRYLRANGFNVRDQPGFDMHGLPIEVQVEKKMGIHSKKQIEEIGIGKFVDTCKSFASDLRESMSEQFQRLGVWMDWENPYQTLKPEFIEAAWWTIARAEERKLLDSSNRVITWCPRCETALAEAEIEYWDETDPSIFVKLPILDRSNAFLVIWTTTPWTLPGNVAVAVNPKEMYCEVVLGGDVEETVYCHENFVKDLEAMGNGRPLKIVKTMMGGDLKGIRYSPAFKIEERHFKPEDAYRVVCADYVETEYTGMVHTAPGFGPDDFDTGMKNGLPIFCPVDESGRYTDQFPMMAGKKVKTANDEIMRHLDENGLLLKKSTIKHRCGHCWRCKSPTIYRNTRQWFFNVPKVKDDMLDGVDGTTWFPSWAGDSRERKWVEDAREWCITRQRYWGIPLPIWECGCGNRHVVANFKELSKGKGYVEGMDMHRPWIDDVTFTCDKCNSEMRRLKDVLDVWFDSGIASWAQLKYPSTDEELNRWWPGRFIIEAHDQTRGWFYTQLAAGIIAFERTPYDQVLMHGWVLDSKGQKMSKSKGNVVEPSDVIDTVGVDPLRMYLLGANAPWEDLAYQKDGPKNSRKALNTFWNVASFASTYMMIDGFKYDESSLKDIDGQSNVEDRWILSRLEGLKAEVTAGIESSEYHKAVRALEDFIVEDLSRWYVRIIRDRSWSEDEASKKSKMTSYAVLYKCLIDASVLLSPFAPHIAEEVYLSLDGGCESVSMEPWPSNADARHRMCDLEDAMNVVKKAIELIAAERAKMDSKLRWPLKGVGIYAKEDICRKVEMFRYILESQGNIKSVTFDTDAPSGAIEFTGGSLIIDFTVTPEIESEGYSRELIRRIQQMRKDMRLNVEDFITCEVRCDDAIKGLISSWNDHICTEVRAKGIRFVDDPKGKEVKEWDISGKNVTIGVTPS